MLQATGARLLCSRRAVLATPLFFARACALLLCAGLVCPTAAQGTGVQRCPQVDANVTGAAPADLLEICKGAATAAAFFAGHGVFPTETLTMRVSRKLPVSAGPSAVGCYIEEEHMTYLVPYAVLQQHKTWFGVAITRAMYRAVASHEAAHAIVSYNFKVPRPSIQAQEYLAYAAMLSGMDAVLRQQVLSTMKPTGFGSLDRFTLLLYLFDPMRFGAETYQHLSSAPDPTGLIHTILSGAALTD